MRMPLLLPARILFDESHSQAWTVRPEIAGDPALASGGLFACARGRGACAGATSRLQSTRRAARRCTRGRRRARARAPVGPRGARRRAARHGSGGELDAIEGFVRAGGGLIVLVRERAGEDGDNLAARRRSASAIANDTSRTTTPPLIAALVLADLGLTCRTAWTCWPACTTCFYAGTLGRLGRRTACGTRAAPIPRADRDVRVLVRASCTSSAPERAAARRRRARRRAGRRGRGLDLFGDDCLGELDHEDPVAEPRPLGGRGAFRRAAAPVDVSREDAHWRAEGRGRRPAPQAAARRQRGSDEHDAVELRVQVDAIIAAVKGLARFAPGRVSGRGPGRPPRLGRRRYESPTSRPRSSASGPTCSARTASSTSSCSRCTSRTARATRSSRR